jgi:hypothetical protein
MRNLSSSGRGSAATQGPPPGQRRRASTTRGPDGRRPGIVRWPALAGSLLPCASGHVYGYELRDGASVVSTGRVTSERPLRVNARVAVPGVLARVCEIVQVAGERRLILEPTMNPRGEKRDV